MSEWQNVTVVVEVGDESKVFADQRYKRIPMAGEVVEVVLSKTKSNMAIVYRVEHYNFGTPWLHCKPFKQGGNPTAPIESKNRK